MELASGTGSPLRRPERAGPPDGGLLVSTHPQIIAQRSYPAIFPQVKDMARENPSPLVQALPGSRRLVLRPMLGRLRTHGRVRMRRHDTWEGTVLDPNEKERAKAPHTDDVKEENRQPYPGAEPDAPSRRGWRAQVVRGALFTVKETLRGISSGVGSVAVTAVILWWQSRH